MAQIEEIDRVEVSIANQAPLGCMPSPNLRTLTQEWVAAGH
jgi:hypothetical protein